MGNNIPKEMIAHDLTLVYLTNIFGVEVSGTVDVNVNGDRVLEDVITDKLPYPEELNYIKQKTGQRGFLGIEKTVKVPNGYKLDGELQSMIRLYYEVYERILSLLQ